MGCNLLDCYKCPGKSGDSRIVALSSKSLYRCVQHSLVAKYTGKHEFALSSSFLISNK